MRRSVRSAFAALLAAGAIGYVATTSAGAAPDVATDAARASETAIRGARLVVAPPTTQAPPPSPGAASLDPLLVTVLELTNQERARVGLPPLTVSPLLNQAAQGHSEDQARRNELTHFGVNGESPGDRIAATGYVFRTWAENAAMGYRTAEHVMDGWMNSPGHRDNILRASVTEIGLGLAYTDSGVPYWTQKFATPR